MGFAEWDAFEDAIISGALTNVKQIVTEFHAWTDHTYAYVRYFRILTALENAGFEKFFANEKPPKFIATNPLTLKRENVPFQWDTGYINTAFL